MTPVLCTAAALWIAPASPSRRIGSARRTAVPVALVPLALAAVVPAVLSTGRASLLLSICIAGATAVHTVVKARASRARSERLVATGAYLGYLIAALRAGSTVPEACSRAFEQVSPRAPKDVAAELRRVSLHTRGGGNGALALASSQLPELRDVGAIWSLAARLGVPVADLLASARTRIDHAVRHQNATKSALAGPRATAVVLSALPLAGVLMGEAMGAHPVSLLTGGGLGGALLLTGTVLVCMGFVTAQHIIGRAAK